MPAAVRRLIRLTKRKVVIAFQRHRNHISIASYLCLTVLLIFGIFHRTYVELFVGRLKPPRYPATTPSSASEAAVSYVTKSDGKFGDARGSAYFLDDLSMLPRREYLCDEMHEQSGVKFVYPEGYDDHADAYRSALTLWNMVEKYTLSEQSWILQDIARLPFVKTVCEMGFEAGHQAFQFLVANDRLVVHSFEQLQRRNYTLEMTDFMVTQFKSTFKF